MCGVEGDAIQEPWVSGDQGLDVHPESASAALDTFPALHRAVSVSVCWDGGGRRLQSRKALIL